MESIRAFIAIELSPAMKESLARLQTWLKGQVGLPVRWVNPDGIHLTLKFLGDVGEERLAGVRDAVASASRGVAPFWVELDGLGAFPSAARPRVIWVGVGGETQPLATLQGKLERLLEPLGFPPEGRAFAPHLTLGRVREPAPRAKGANLQDILKSCPRAEARQLVDAVSLMKSDLRPQGAVYTQITVARLEVDS